VLDRSDDLGDFLQMQVHRFGVAERRNEAGAFAVVGADRAEYIGRGGALIVGADGLVPRLDQRRVILLF